MKAPTVVLATLALTAFANAQLAERTPGSEMRTWTNTDGVEIQASLVEKKESSVLLKLENGRQYDVPLEKLSGSDIAWIEEMEAAKVAAAEASEGLAFSPILAEVGSVIFEDNLSEIREGWGMGNGEWKNDEEGALIGKELEADDHAATFRRNLPLENAVIQFSFKLDGARATTFSIDNSTGHLCRLSINASGFTGSRSRNSRWSSRLEGSSGSEIERINPASLGPSLSGCPARTAAIILRICGRLRRQSGSGRWGASIHSEHRPMAMVTRLIPVGVS